MTADTPVAPSGHEPMRATARNRLDAAIPAVRLRGISKRFGALEAVAGLELEIVDGEFFSMLGPSGSGKTTTLRMIAGFEAPSAGRIELHGRDVTDLPPFDRDVNTVFQDYALFPHMTVGENVAYGLAVRKVPRDEQRKRVADALRMVRLPEYEGRRPLQLSGGQRQRIALARALVNRPRVLLLDEPLGALDLTLREEMQIELKAIQQQVGITFVYVTHDQEEALTMSDRIAVFNRGRIEQVGTAADVYERPATGFVAGFVGTSNLLADAAARAIAGRSGTFTVRPEKIRIQPEHVAVAPGHLGATGTVREVVYLGPDTRFIVTLDAGAELVVTQQNLETSSDDVAAARGSRVRLSWSRDHLLPVAGGEGGAIGPGETTEPGVEGGHDVL